MNSSPKIESVKPSAALPGGEIAIYGTGFAVRNHSRPQVQFGSTEGSLILAADNYLVARVPEGASWGAVRVLMRSEEHTSELQSPVHLVCRLLLEKKKTSAMPAPNTPTAPSC